MQELSVGGRSGAHRPEGRIVAASPGRPLRGWRAGWLALAVAAVSAFLPLGRVAAEVLDALVPHVVPGVTTAELDAIAFHEMAARGAVPETAVALALPRSAELLVAIWAVA